MNKERLKAIIDHIEANPASWDRRAWNCGALYCIEGLAQMRMEGMTKTKTQRGATQGFGWTLEKKTPTGYFVGIELFKILRIFT